MIGLSIGDQKTCITHYKRRDVLLAPRLVRVKALEICVIVVALRKESLEREEEGY
jgi:hypothetical protein